MSKSTCGSVAVGQSVVGSSVAEGVVLHHALTSNVPSFPTAEHKKLAPSSSSPPVDDGGAILYANHVLESTDEIGSLAIRYGSTIEGIMRANGMLSKDLDLLPVSCVLRVPLTHEKPVAQVQPAASLADIDHSTRVLRKRITKDFAAAHNISVEEAAFYLEDTEFDVGSAKKLLDEDIHWEKQNKQQLQHHHRSKASGEKKLKRLAD